MQNIQTIGDHKTIPKTDERPSLSEPTMMYSSIATHLPMYINSNLVTLTRSLWFIIEKCKYKQMLDLIVHACCETRIM